VTSTSKNDTVERETPKQPVRRGARFWLLVSLVGLTGAVGVFVFLQGRARDTARERAKAEALRDLEEAKREAERAQGELRQAMDRMDRERQRLDDAKPSRLGARPVPKAYLRQKVLRVDEFRRQSADEPASEPRD
jgi:uncharacterized protein HemX